MFARRHTQGNGDAPQVGKKNRYHAHMWNDGIVDQTNLQVTYYLISPPGVGDNGNWIPLWTRFVSGVAAGNHSRVTPNGLVSSLALLRRLNRINSIGRRRCTELDSW